MVEVSQGDSVVIQTTCWDEREVRNTWGKHRRCADVWSMFVVQWQHVWQLSDMHWPQFWLSGRRPRVGNEGLVG